MPSLPEFYPSRNNAATEEEGRGGGRPGWGSKPNELDTDKVAGGRIGEKRESRSEGAEIGRNGRMDVKPKHG